MIGHLNDEDTFAARHNSFGVIPVLMNAAERVALMTGNSKACPDSLPKTRKALESQMQAKFGKTLSLAEVEATIQGLILAKVIAVSDKGEIACKA